MTHTADLDGCGVRDYPYFERGLFLDVRDASASAVTITGSGTTAVTTGS